MDKGINTIVTETTESIANAINEALGVLPPSIVALIVKDALMQVEQLNKQVLESEKAQATAEKTEVNNE